MLAFGGYGAQAYMLELGPNEADGNDAEEGHDEQHGGAGGGGFRA
jgi:hypothetical protein